MKSLITFIAAIFLVHSLNAQNPYDISTHWKLAIHAQTFSSNSMFETIDITRSLGIPWMEGKTGQTVDDSADVKFNHHLSAYWKGKVKDKLRASGVTMTTLGLIEIPNEEKKAREVFDFAKDMGVKTLIIQPASGDLSVFDLVEKLCDEYGIRVAIHNQSASGSRNSEWPPEEILKACDGRSKLIGASADIGEWMLSGIDPVDAVRKLKGRILNVHLRDISEGHDVVYTDRVLEVLSELKKQEYSGQLAIRFEHNLGRNIPEVEKCIQYYNQTVDKLRTQKALLLTKENFSPAAESGVILSWLANKQIGNATGLTLGYVIIKPGEANPRHKHELIEEVLFLMEGKLLKTVGDEEYTMSKGDVIWIPPGEFHNAKNIGTTDAVMVVVYSDALRGFELESKIKNTK